MKLIPREELAFIVDHLSEEDVYSYTMKLIFDIYGDD